MNIYTLNVGQGQFVVVVGNTEAIIVDTFIPLNPVQDIIYVKAALSNILSGKKFIGLMITGFDADHFNEVGMKVVLNKYRPDWIMYPKYFKETKTANACFGVIGSFESQKKIQRISVSLGRDDTRIYNHGMSNDFTFEVFSPHASDMNSSNNCSLVCKIQERSTGAKYLVTGDTENDRWNSIVKIFGRSIASDVLAAPHHGSKNGITIDAMKLINPHTVLISAGVDNSYDHPDREAMTIFNSVANKVYSTNHGEGQSLRTVILENSVNTYKYEI